MSGVCSAHQHHEPDCPRCEVLDLTNDTMAPWLYQRYGNTRHFVGWFQLSGDDQDYWEHEAEAVRRAVARGGFKNPEEKQ